MSRSGHRTIACLSALFLSLPALALAREGRLIGKVLDPDGKPIAGVRVTTTCSEIPDFKQIATTDKKGIFKVDFERLYVVYLYQMEKPGYVSLRIEQKWTVQGTDRHDFTMSPAEEPAPGAATTAAAPASASAPAIAAFNAGVRALKAEDYPTALTKLQEALQHDPKLRAGWVAVTAVQMHLEHYAEAAEAAEKAIALGSTAESVLKARWEAYRQLHEDDKAAAARAELEKHGQLSEEAKRVYNEGVALEKAGTEEGAFARFKEAHELDPAFAPALLGLGTSALKLGKAAEAASAAESLLELNPGDPEALKIRYNAALKLGDEAKVVDALLGLAAVDATTASHGLFVIADGAFQRDDTATAKKLFQQVLEIDPAHARSHYFLGLILMREGAKKEARSHLERFLELAPNDPDAGTARDALKYLR